MFALILKRLGTIIYAALAACILNQAAAKVWARISIQTRLSLTKLQASRAKQRQYRRTDCRFSHRLSGTAANRTDPAAAARTATGAHTLDPWERRVHRA